MDELFDESYVDRKRLEYEDRKLGDGEIGIIGNGKRIRRNYDEDNGREENGREVGNSRHYG